MDGLGGIQSGSLRPSQVLGATGEITVTDNGNGTVTLSIASGLNPFIIKGNIDCSGNPNYPAADAGHVYVVSVAGKIGGASGTVVTVADIAICIVDGSASGTQAAVGANWIIGQANIDLTNITISGGTISGCDVTVGSGKTLDVSGGTLTLAADQISGDKVEGGTINAITITTLTAPTIYGSSAANGDITIEGTSNGTKTTSYVILQSTGGYVGIGTTTPQVAFDVSNATRAGVRLTKTGASAGYAGFYNDGNAHFEAETTGGKLFAISANSILYRLTSGGATLTTIDNTTGSILLGGLSAPGTSAASVLAIGNGTAPTAIVANGVQAWSADFLGTGGDARLHIIGEASATAKVALGSGKVTVLGTTGGFTRAVSENSVNITAAATCTIEVNIPATSRIIGVQLRVDTALTAGELWDASFSGGSTDSICTGQAVAKSTKVNALPSIVVTSETDIAITKNGGGSFTAAGNIRAWVYYEYLETVADAA